MCFLLNRWRTWSETKTRRSPQGLWVGGISGTGGNDCLQNRDHRCYVSAGNIINGMAYDYGNYGTADQDHVLRAKETGQWCGAEESSVATIFSNY